MGTPKPSVVETKVSQSAGSKASLADVDLLVATSFGGLHHFNELSTHPLADLSSLINDGAEAIGVPRVLARAPPGAREPSGGDALTGSGRTCADPAPAPAAPA